MSVRGDYLKWLCQLVYDCNRKDGASFSKLLKHLHEFIFLYDDCDTNRADDGKQMRYRFALNEYGLDPLDTDYIVDSLTGECTVLEMMIALCLRCEEELMDDPDYGNRTSQWFWEMIVSLGLGSMYNSNYDAEYIDDCLWAFLNRDYTGDGVGGLFTIHNFHLDMRELDLWDQMNWYINYMTY